MRHAARVVVVAVATIGLAVAVWNAIGWLNPPHQDLSDIGTGLMQVLLAVLAALVGLAISVAATRRGPR